MRKVISSIWTPFFKFVFPAVWVGPLAVMTVAMFFDGHTGKWVCLALLFAGSAMLFWMCVPLKRVELDGRTLRISNYREVTEVDVADIRQISENRLENLHPVWLHFETPTVFGDKIKFMPHALQSPMGFLESHPIVDQLWRRREAARKSDQKNMKSRQS